MVALDFLHNEQAVGSLVVSVVAAATAAASDAFRSTFFSAVSTESVMLSVSFGFLRFAHSDGGQIFRKRQSQIMFVLFVFFPEVAPNRPNPESQGGNTGTPNL